jgi:hypothetical protein
MSANNVLSLQFLPIFFFYFLKFLKKGLMDCVRTVCNFIYVKAIEKRDEKNIYFLFFQHQSFLIFFFLHKPSVNANFHYFSLNPTSLFFPHSSTHIFIEFTILLSRFSTFIHTLFLCQLTWYQKKIVFFFSFYFIF